MVHIDNAVLLSHEKKKKKRKEIIHLQKQMNPEIVILSEVSQKEKARYHISHLYVESKLWQKRTYLQNRNRLTDTVNRLVVAWMEGSGGEGWTGNLGLAEANYYV